MSTKKKYMSKHKEIIEGAIKVFARKGFYNTKVSEIAQEANVAGGTIYLYFKNKDDILATLFEEKVDMIIHRMEEELAKVDDPLDKIRTFVEHHLKLVKENKDLAEVMQIELRQSSKFMRRYVPVKFLKYMGLIGEIIEEGKREGVVREDVIPAIAKRAIFGALDEMSLYWVLAKTPKYGIEQSIEQMNSLFIDALRSWKTHNKEQDPAQMVS